MNERYDIYGRSFKFAVNVARVVDKLPSGIAIREYARQLIRSSSSIGANLEEADGALTRKDFIHKIGIARRESSETRYWLKLINEIAEYNNAKNEIRSLENESKEILLILSSIIKNSKQSN
jgi:four helix bundle protein